MKKYILKQLLEIERDLVIGDDFRKLERTLENIRKLSGEICSKIRNEEEKQMISDTVDKIRKGLI
jgi:hypothetical protein